MQGLTLLVRGRRSRLEGDSTFVEWVVGEVIAQHTELEENRTEKAVSFMDQPLMLVFFRAVTRGHRKSPPAISNGYVVLKVMPGGYVASVFLVRACQVLASSLRFPVLINHGQ